MKFGEFQAVCKYMSFGYKGGSGIQFEPVCKRPDRIPRGHSWGKCVEQCCPYFGIKIGPGEIYMNGEKIGTFDKARLVLDGEEPQNVVNITIPRFW